MLSMTVLALGLVKAVVCSYIPKGFSGSHWDIRLDRTRRWTMNGYEWADEVAWDDLAIKLQYLLSIG